MPLATSLRLAALAVLAGALGGCQPESFEESFEETRSVSGRLVVEIENGSGDTCVVRGEGPRAKIGGRVVAYALTREAAHDVAELIVRDPPIAWRGDVLHVGDLTKYQRDDLDREGRGYDADDEIGEWAVGALVTYRLEVPFDTEVRITSGSGHACVEGLAGPVHVATGSGDVDVVGIAKEVVARSDSGRVNVQGALAADAQTVSGAVRFLDVEHDAAARTDSGDVELTGIGGGVTAETTSGDVHVDSAFGRDATWRADSQSGRVRFVLPTDASFDVDVQTVSGRVESAFEVVQPRGVDAGLLGRVGRNPAGIVRIRTRTGAVQLAAHAG